MHLPLLLLLTALVYAGTWGHGFVNYDDDVTIINLTLIRELSFARLPDFFRPDIHRGLPEYMPLKNLSYAVDYALFGLDPRGFRIQQQLWYLACVALVFVWTRSMLTRLQRSTLAAIPAARIPLLAFMVALLFAVHPAHVEAVTWLSGRKDVLSGAFMMATLVCALRWQGELARPRWLLAALACSVLSLLSKPTAVVLPALLLLQDWVGPAPIAQTLRRRLPLYLGSACLVVGFALFYVQFTQAHAAALGGVEQRLFGGPAWLRWGQQYARYLGLGIAPIAMSPLLPPELLDPRLLSPMAITGALVLLALLAASGWALRKRSPWLLALGLFAIPLVPSVLAPAWGQYVAVRYMFHAVLGIALALVLGGALLAAARPKLARVIAFALLGVSLTWASSTLAYNATWARASSLWLGALGHYPRFTELHDLGARAAIAEQNPALAVEILSACLQVAPDDGACLAQMGGLLLGPNPDAGEAMLRRALPDDREGRAHRTLARHLLQTGRAAEGLSLLAEHTRGRPTNVQTLALLASLASAAGERAQALGYARHMVRAAASNHPASPPPVAALRALAHQLGDAELAARVDAAAARCQRSDCFVTTLGL